MRVITLIIVLIVMRLQSASATVTEAEVVVVKGTVTTTAPSATERVSVARGRAISVGSRIDTGDKSDLLMSPFPSSAVRVLENNSVVLTETDLEKSGETILGRKAKLQLQKGGVQIALDRIPGSHVDFKVTTPQCVAAARGTVFGVNVIEGKTITIVGTGIVAVPWIDAKGKTISVDVKAGMKLTLQQTPTGLVQIGPEKATEEELAGLRDFVNESIQLGLLALPFIGEFTSTGPIFIPAVGARAITGKEFPEIPTETIVTPL